MVGTLEGATWKRSPRGNRANNLFVCGCCGRKLRKNPAKEPHLVCPKNDSIKGAECAGLFVNQAQIEQAVLQMLREQSRSFLEQHCLMQACIDKKLSSIQTELDANTNMTRRLQSRKAELYEQYRAGRISREKFADIQKTDSEKLARLSSRAEEIKRLLVEHYESRGNLAAGKRTADQIILLKDYDPRSFLFAQDKQVGVADEIRRAVEDQHLVDLVFREISAERGLVVPRAAGQTAQRRMTQQAVKRAGKAAKNTAAARRVVQAVTKAVASLVSSLIGLVGGGILLIVLVVVIIIAAVANSPFGLFFAEERSAPDTVSVAEAVGTVNVAYNTKLEELQAGRARAAAGPAAAWPVGGGACRRSRPKG